MSFAYFHKNYEKYRPYLLVSKRLLENYSGVNCSFIPNEYIEVGSYSKSQRRNFSGVRAHIQLYKAPMLYSSLRISMLISCYCSVYAYS
jgi:hypothetical protein